MFVAQNAVKLRIGQHIVVEKIANMLIFNIVNKEKDFMSIIAGCFLVVERIIGAVERNSLPLTIVL